MVIIGNFYRSGAVLGLGRNELEILRRRRDEFGLLRMTIVSCQSLARLRREGQRRLPQSARNGVSRGAGPADGGNVPKLSLGTRGRLPQSARKGVSRGGRRRSQIEFGNEGAATTDRFLRATRARATSSPGHQDCARLGAGDAVVADPEDASGRALGIVAALGEGGHGAEGSLGGSWAGACRPLFPPTGRSIVRARGEMSLRTQLLHPHAAFS